MFGIIIGDTSDPYVRSDSLEQAVELCKANRHRGHDAWLVVGDPLCDCGERVPGWFEIDVDGTILDPYFHEPCGPRRLDEWEADLSR